MKIIKNCLLVFTVIALYNSCKKEEEKNAMDFKITGVNNTTIIRTQTIDMNLNVFFLGGDKEEVKLSTSGMPDDVSITFSPEKGEPDFSFTATIHAGAVADSGVFPITITATSVNNSKTFSKTFNLTVLPVPNSLPLITLYGGASITSVLNDPYTDPGYVAYDVEDGIISGNVAVYGTVNKDSAGTYKISYVVYDSDGDKDSVVRSVRIKNTAEFMSGSYTCSPVTPAAPPCQTGININSTVNNKVFCANSTNCYTANLYFDIDIPNHKVLLDTQSTLFQGVMHTYSGEATYSVTGSSVQFTLIYSDSYTDTLGNNIVQNRQESYLKL